MSYVSEIFDRLDIQHIREFLLHGTECIEVSEKSYKQRIEDSRKTTIALIRAKFPEQDEYEQITAEVYSYVSEIEAIYMEIGLQCGAVLASQLLTNILSE